MSVGLDLHPRAAAQQTSASGAQGFVTVVSGKGGVGKSSLAANLAVAAAALRRRVLLVDGDLGLANIDILLGLAPPRSVADVWSGACGIEDALVRGPRGVEILPAASGRTDLAAPSPLRMEAFLDALRASAAKRDLVLIDAGAGVGPGPVGFAAASARVLLVTTPEPTSLADAYATLKVIEGTAPGRAVDLVVNECDGELQARRTHQHLEKLSRRFLARGVGLAGHLPRDRRVGDAVLRQQPLVEAFPTSRAARMLVALAARVVAAASPSQALRGEGP